MYDDELSCARMPGGSVGPVIVPVLIAPWEQKKN
jgi:hypothetical protein